MRIDRDPFKDIRVRRALAMAIDKQAILDDIYHGQGVRLATLVSPEPEFINTVYTPLEKQSSVVQEYYGYHPDTARKLLTEAGYPSGFKVAVDCVQSQVDILSIVKDDMTKVGIDLDIEVYETAVYQSLYMKRMHDPLLMAGMSNVAIYAMNMVRPGLTTNASMIDDQRCNDAYAEVQKYVIVNEAKAN
jgi:ABC-type transport system substrate-binding protein